MSAAVYQRFMRRWTPEEHARLSEIEASHYLESCPFVEAMRTYDYVGPDSFLAERAVEFRNTNYWTSIAGDYVGEKHRFSAKFVKPFGDHVIASGNDARPSDKYPVPRNDGQWDYVAGEFEAR